MNKGDEVLVPFGKAALPGVVVDTKWKVNSEWAIVEVEYTDLAGIKNIKPIRPDRLIVTSKAPKDRKTV